MVIPDFESKYITKAFQIFDRDYREKEQWAKFTNNRNNKYAITHKNKLYLVKEIIRITAQEAELNLPHFNGGKEANSFIRKRGFEIIDLKVKRSNLDLVSGLNRVLDEYYQARMNDQFAQHELGDLLRHDLPEIVANKLQSYSLDNDYEIKGSIGQANWARSRG
jgi:hypothetical protein